MKRNALAMGLIVMICTISVSAIELNFLGSYEPPRECWLFEGILIGELSGLSFAANESYYAIGDDRGENVMPPGVLYELDIDVDLEGIHSIAVTDIIRLDSDINLKGIQPYFPEDLDGEEVLWTSDGFIVCSERDSDNAPWIRQFTHTGELIAELPVPEKFIPVFADDEQVRGVRVNLSFEAATITPDGNTLYVANEQALVQDGNVSTADAGTAIDRKSVV